MEHAKGANVFKNSAYTSNLENYRDLYEQYDVDRISNWAEWTIRKYRKFEIWDEIKDYEEAYGFQIPNLSMKMKKVELKQILTNLIKDSLIHEDIFEDKYKFDGTPFEQLGVIKDLRTNKHQDKYYTVKFGPVIGRVFNGQNKDGTRRFKNMIIRTGAVGIIYTDKPLLSKGYEDQLKKSIDNLWGTTWTEIIEYLKDRYGNTPEDEFFNHHVDNDGKRISEYPYTYTIEERASPSGEPINKIPLKDNSAPRYHSFGVINRGFDDTCVYDTLIEHFRGQYGFKNLSRKNLEKEFDDICLIKGEITLDDIITYLNKRQVSYRFIDPFRSDIGMRQHGYAIKHDIKTLYAMINNGHINLISSNDDKTDVRFSRKRGAKVNWYSPDIDMEICNDIWNLHDELIKFNNKDSSSQKLMICTDNSVKNLEAVIAEIAGEENLFVENITDEYCKFTYKNVFVVHNPEYKHVQQTIPIIQQIDEIRKLEYQFKNQSIVSLGWQIFNNFIEIPKCRTSPQVLRYFKTPPILQQKFDGDKSIHNHVFSYDANRSHPSILREITRYYVIDYSDTVKSCVIESIDDIKQGYYCAINPSGFHCDEFNLGRALTMRDNQLKICIDLGIIKLEHIKWYLQPSSYIDVDFKKYFDIIDSLDVKSCVQKKMRTAVIGKLGQTRSTHKQYQLTNDERIVDALLQDFTITSTRLIQNIERDENGKIYVPTPGKGSIYAMEKITEKIHYENYKSLHQDILMQQMINLLKTRRLAKGELLAYNTDMVMVSYKDHIGADGAPIRELVKPGYGFYKIEKNKWNTGGGITSRVDKISDIKYDFHYNKASLEIVKEQGGLIKALAGTGKTFSAMKVVNELAQEGKRVVCIGYSHQVHQQMHKEYDSHMRRSEENLDVKSTPKFDTVTMFLRSSAEMTISEKCMKIAGMNIDYIVVDEIFCVNPEEMRQLYMIHLACRQIKSNIKFIFCGDNNQLPPVAKYPIDINHTFMMWDMCRNMLTLTKRRRYDDKHGEICDKIRLGEEINISFEDDMENVFTHLVFTHKKRIALNNRCMREFLKMNPELCRVDIKVDRKKEFTPGNYNAIQNKPQDVTVCVGMPLISCGTYKTMNITNRDKFVIQSLDSESLTIQGTNWDKTITLGYKEFHTCLRLGFATTIHSSQGATLHGTFGVHEISKWNRAMAYTMLTRAKTTSQIRCEEVFPKTFPKETIKTQCVEYWKRYTKHFVYQRRFNDCSKDLNNQGELYIGQTNNLVRRLGEHREEFENCHLTTIHTANEYNVSSLEAALIIHYNAMLKMLDGGKLMNKNYNSSKHVPKTQPIKVAIMKTDVPLVGTVSEIKGRRPGWRFRNGRDTEVKFMMTKKRSLEMCHKLALQTQLEHSQ